jgi:hypothetical protein
MGGELSEFVIIDRDFETRRLIAEQAAPDGCHGRSFSAPDAAVGFMQTSGEVFAVVVTGTSLSYLGRLMMQANVAPYVEVIVRPTGVTNTVPEDLAAAHTCTVLSKESGLDDLRVSLSSAVHRARQASKKS